MAKKDLEGIVNSETNHNPSSEISTKKYLGWKLAGHGLGAAFSIGSAYLLENTLGYGKAFTSGAQEIFDKAGDEGGFHIARSFSERKKPKYQGLAGLGRYITDSVGYTMRHIPGALLGMGAAALATYGISTFFQLPVYIAAAFPRAAEIATEIISSTFFTKSYRQRLSQPSYAPS